MSRDHQRPLDPEKHHLLGLLPADLVELYANESDRLDRKMARRILAHTISFGQHDLEITGLSKRRKERLHEVTTLAPLETVERADDPNDGFVKYLFRAPDGETFEAVRIPLHKKGRFTVCLSSQVGCAMGCAFCATGRLGWTRNLAPWEMVAAFCAIRDDVDDGRVTGAVFMGQGEPLQNYDAVIQAARVLSHPCGGRISAEAISISTVGNVEKIRRYTREGHRYRLILSLTSAIPERRRELLPVASRQPLEDLADALREHAAAINDLVTVAWVLLSGVNTGRDEAEALRALLKDVPLRLNLIDLNVTDSSPFRPADEQERYAFIDELQILKAPVVRRYSGGVAAHAACGMLRNARIHQDSSPAPSNEENRPAAPGADTIDELTLEE